MEDHDCFGVVLWFGMFGYRLCREGSGQTGQIVIDVR